MHDGSGESCLELNLLFCVRGELRVSPVSGKEEMFYPPRKTLKKEYKPASLIFLDLKAAVVPVLLLLWGKVFSIKFL